MTANETLKKYFGYDSFRDGQETIINTILSGRDALAIMPTGAGKSICYQVPALMMSGITLVISPLISLMQDQVKSLNDAGINAAYINSSLTEKQVSMALDYAAKGVYKIIYVAPERLENEEFLYFADNAGISMVTVDEAHCISQWGQDFRPSYLKIADFVNRLPVRPVLSSFTATATKEVKNDILCILGLKEPEIVITGFDRKNLYYSVENIKRKDEFIIDYIEKHRDDSGIIYCSIRKNVDAVQEMLASKGVAVTKYHAGMNSDDRKQSQDDFIYDRKSVIVATNAFGMGIDKSNVRYVIHYNMPQSMENYYQEAGRAGRDGEQSQCILLFSPQDVMINRFLLDNKDFSDIPSEDIELIKEHDNKRLQAMEGYCRTTGCLRNYILEYFGEKTDAPCGDCGNCNQEYEEVDMTREAKWIINCVVETKSRYGINVILGTLLGANRARLKELHMTECRTYGALKDSNEKILKDLVNQMVLEEYLHKTNDRYSILKIGNISSLRDENAKVMMRMNKEQEETREKNIKKKPLSRRSTDELTSAGFELFELLRGLRLEIAKEEAMPPYIIFSDKTLIDMCVKMPLDAEQMLDVSGVGMNKLTKYGERFLSVIKKYAEENEGRVTSIDHDK